MNKCQRIVFRELSNLSSKLNKLKLLTKMSDEAIEADRPSSSASNEHEFVFKKKLRVLCLHGYRQNAESFKAKLGAFRKQNSKYAEFVFITAPHKAAPLVEGEQVPDEQCSWWFNHEDGTFNAHNRNGPAYGFEKSLRLVEEAWQQQGPFEGLLGFSQGACLVGIICGLAQRKLTCISAEFAIMAAGFKSGSLVHRSVYEHPIFKSSLHVFGSTDEIIPKDMSLELMHNFNLTTPLEHTGGHYFPATAAQKKTYREFFEQRIIYHEMMTGKDVIYTPVETVDKQSGTNDSD